jgi:hypothetical protein
LLDMTNIYIFDFAENYASGEPEMEIKGEDKI